MRSKLLIICIYISTLTLCAVDCSTFISIDGKIKICINNNSLKIILLPSEETERIQLDSDNKLIGEVIFFSKDNHFQNDILIVKDQIKTYYFEKSNFEILISQSNIAKYIKKGDRFYCSNYRFPDNSVLSNGKWKNNKKDGKWIYKKANEIFIYTFKDGIIVHKKKIR